MSQNFKVGMMVKWAPKGVCGSECDYDRHIREYGHGPFRVESVQFVPRPCTDPMSPEYRGEEDIARSVGHPQWIFISKDGKTIQSKVGPSEAQKWSGAWFEEVRVPVSA